MHHADPAYVALMRQSLFGKDELEALELPKGTGLDPAPPRMTGRLCMSLDGFNVHAATTVRAGSAGALGPLRLPAGDRRQAAGRSRPRPCADLAEEPVARRKDLGFDDKPRPTAGILAQIPLPRRASTDFFALWGPAVKGRQLVVPALGARVAHNKRKGKPKAQDDGVAQAENDDHEHHDGCGNPAPNVAEPTETERAAAATKRERG